MKNFEKKKKNAWRYYHFALVYYKWQSWCMVPDISSTADRIFCHFGLFLALLPPTIQKINILKKSKKAQGDIIISHMCTINGNHLIYDSWGINCNRQIFLSSLAISCPFTISSFYTSVTKTIIIDYTLPETWDMTDEIVIFHFGLFFALLPPSPPNSQKNESFKKILKHLKISSFYTGVPKLMIIYYTVPEISCVTDVIAIFHFGLFFALLPRTP